MDYLAEMFDSPVTSKEHVQLREDAWLGGEIVVARYFLGALVGKNLFRMSHDEFRSELRQWLAREFSEDIANVFASQEHWCKIVLYIRRECLKRNGWPPQEKPRRIHHAIEILLKHPKLTDEQICEMVPTTVAQLERFVQYRELRNAIRQQFPSTSPQSR